MGLSSLLTGGLKAALRQPALARNRRRGLIVRPLFLDYAVTWRCNARCVMCDTWQRPAKADAELSVADWQAIFTRDAEFLTDIKKVGFTGGEPFLRSDLVDLVRLFHQRLPEARISVVSNGLLTERILKALGRIRDFLPDMIFSVSLDGLGPVHDQVRGIPGAYDKAMATLKGAAELGFTVTSGMTISQLNFHQIEAVSQTLAGMGVDFSCNLQERGANFYSEGGAPDLTPEQSGQVERALGRFSHHYYMDNVRQSIGGRARTLPCFSGYTSYFLHPGGELCYCNLMGEPLGNLREQGFRQIADSPKAWAMRRKLADCTCMSQCEVKNSAAVAPWHVLAWLIRNPRKTRFFKHYAAKGGLLPK